MIASSTSLSLSLSSPKFVAQRGGYYSFSMSAVIRPSFICSWLKFVLRGKESSSKLGGSLLRWFYSNLKYTLP